MARNSEKAMTTLARWRAAQEGGLKVKERRPYLAGDCDDIHQAEKWRRQILGEISRKVAQIQNAGLGEFKLRDLNDEINKLLREKGHWEDRIIELGGPDYRKIGPKMLDAEGKEVPGNRGYKYFGAAKDLPGVRELFQQEPPPAPRKTRAELMKDIDADYYGYRDEDDGLIVPAEQEAEREAVASKVAEWKERVAKIARGEIVRDEDLDPEENLYPPEEVEMEEETKEESDGEKEHFIAHVPVPSQQEIEAAIVQRKKTELLKRYATDSLMEEEESVKQMLGV
ncbi:pre-mRNA-splicing factor ISY1 homolog [Babylonia areolata]|uniref:pre-mRNA-splicing factor ISY1 homolog n=1 Tax=Babylonia areolata TaxID=304850 RepID=UPI003FD06166